MESKCKGFKNRAPIEGMVMKEMKSNMLVFFACALITCTLTLQGGDLNGDADKDNHVDGVGVELSLDVVFTNGLRGAFVIFSLSNTTDKVRCVVESSFVENDFKAFKALFEYDFNFCVKRSDGVKVPVRDDALTELIRRSEILRRLLVDLKPHSNYRKIGDLISSYDLILSNDYVVEGSCKIYRRDSFGKNHLIGVVSAAKKFKTPSVSFQQNVGPILGNKRRQEDRL